MKLVSPFIVVSLLKAIAAGCSSVEVSYLCAQKGMTTDSFHLATSYSGKRDKHMR